MLTGQEFQKLNQRDISDGIRLLLNRGQDNRPLSQSLLGEFSDVGNDIISKIMNPDNSPTYSPTVKTLSKILSVFNMTFVDFFKFVDDNIKVR